jgi:DNA-binding MarR family transcriptional regulator
VFSYRSSYFDGYSSLKPTGQPSGCPFLTNKEVAMRDKDLVVCMKASRLGLSMREASAYFSIGYDIVEEISNKYAIKFACSRRRANETRAAERRTKKNAQVARLNDRIIQQKEKTQPKATVGGTIVPNRDRSKEYIKRKFKALISGASTQAEKYERVYGYLMQQEYEKHRKPNKLQVPSKTRQQEITIKRRLIMLAINEEELIAPEIVQRTDLPIHCITALLHKMELEGIVNKERVSIKGRKNKVWSYSRAKKLGTEQ